MKGCGRRDELTGFTVGLTAARRSVEFQALLARHGATTMVAPAIRIVHLERDDHLRDVTRALIADPADVLVVTTGFGFRGWIDAARTWGLADLLFAALRRMRIVARGPKALGAVRHAGLREDWSAPSESSIEVVDHLIDEAASLRIAVQLHGAGGELEPNADVCMPLSRAGADVVKIPVYRWEPTTDLASLDNLITTAVDGRLDALTFTSAPAVASLVGRAQALQVLPELITGLNSHTLVACVGPVTATPLNRLGVSTVAPARYRLGALARLILDELPRRATRVHSAGHVLELRNTGVLVDRHWRPMTPAGMTMLRQLISAGGHIVPPRDLLTSQTGQHHRAAQTAIMRLRAALGVPHCIETVEKKGYRMAPQA